MTKIAGKFGRLAPHKHYKGLLFENYLTGELPKAPNNVDRLSEVMRKININDPKVLFPMDDNDTLGCCGIAGMAHIRTIFHGLIYDKCINGPEWVKNFYLNFTGGQDSGVVLTDVLDYWMKKPIDGEQILGYAKIDPKNIEHVKLGLELFGAIYLGFNVQENAISDFENRIPWTSGNLTGDGHCVVCGAWDQHNEGIVLTWGDEQPFKLSWWQECVDEAYVIIPKQAKYSAFAPGFNIEQLEADAKLISNGTYNSLT